MALCTNTKRALYYLTDSPFPFLYYMPFTIRACCPTVGAAGEGWATTDSVLIRPTFENGAVLYNIRCLVEAGKIGIYPLDPLERKKYATHCCLVTTGYMS